MEQYQEDQTINEFNRFQKHVSEVHPATISLEYFTLRLSGEVGHLSNAVARIARGEFSNKGAHAYESVVEQIMCDCHDILKCVALIATVLEKKMSDVIEIGKQGG